MKILSNSRCRRRTSFAVLLFWLFASGAGWANACLLEARGTHADTGVALDAEGTQLSVISAGHAGAIATHDEAWDSTKAPCLKVCDNGSQTMVKLTSAGNLPDPGIAPVLAVDWNPIAPVLWPVASNNEDSLIIYGPPLRTRYSRLAL